MGEPPLCFCKFGYRLWGGDLLSYVKLSVSGLPKREIVGLHSLAAVFNHHFGLALPAGGAGSKDVQEGETFPRSLTSAGNLVTHVLHISRTACGRIGDVMLCYQK